MSKTYTSNNTGGFAGSGAVGSGGGVGLGGWQQAQQQHVVWQNGTNHTIGVQGGGGGGGISREELEMFSRNQSEIIIKELAKIYRDNPLTNEQIDNGIEFRRRHLMNVIANESRKEIIASLQDADVHADVSNILNMALLLY